MPEEEFELIEKKGQMIKVYPDGRRYLVERTDEVLNTAVETYADQLVADSVLQQTAQSVVEKKKSELNNAGLPSEKSPI